MRELFRIDLKDYNINDKQYVRPSARGIIVNNGKVAMIYSQKYDYYKFPGGGIELNENMITALKREVLEETGLSLVDDSIKEFGSVMRIQKSRFNENEININRTHFHADYDEYLIERESRVLELLIKEKYI